MISYFSMTTIRELLDENCLTETQVCREYDRFVKLTNTDCSLRSRDNLTDKVNFIRDKIDFFSGYSEPGRDTTGGIDTTQDSTLPSLALPTTNFSNIKGVTKPFELLQTARDNELDYLASNPNIPYIRYTNSDFVKKNTETFQLLNDTVGFNYKLNRRDIAYYGDYDYRYTGAFHKARPIADCTVLDNICKNILSLFPTFKFNSVLVSRYNDGGSKCPPHSDDESSIVSDSLILSLSFGAQRRMNVRRKMEFVCDGFDLKAGDILVMSKASQTNYDHAIPESDEDVGVRISLTFRLIEPTRGSASATPHITRAPPPQARHSPKRVLVLSDSKNLGFDTSDFKSGSVACFKEACYTLDSIPQHESKIALADVVLISTGVNDIIKERGDVLQLFDYLRSLMESYYAKYPDKKFIFYAITEVSSRFIDYNSTIDIFNDYCFEMSLRLPNFKVFNNLFFDTNRHLASDGLHYSKYGKWSASAIWTQAAECALGIRDARLPLRPRYLERLDEFLGRSSYRRTG